MNVTSELPFYHLKATARPASDADIAIIIRGPGRFDEHPPSGLILERISDHREHREEVSPAYLIHLRV
jgi:hypothetical protein